MELRKCECGGEVIVFQTIKNYYRCICKGCTKMTKPYRIGIVAIQAWNEGKVE